MAAARCTAGTASVATRRRQRAPTCLAHAQHAQPEAAGDALSRRLALSLGGAAVLALASPPPSRAFTRPPPGAPQPRAP